MLLVRLAFVFLVSALFSVAFGQDQVDVSSSLISALSKKYPNARIDLTDAIHWSSAEPQGRIQYIQVGEENARAQVQFSVQSQTEEGIRSSNGWVTFAAMVPARVVARRVMPGEKLETGQFASQEVNVASGPNHDLRGLILPPSSDISHLDARQTLLEGQPLLSSAVERTPDVRRGDAVRVQLISNGLTLSTQATASEPGYLNEPVRVLTEKTKRELSGKLVASGVVEVRL